MKKSMVIDLPKPIDQLIFKVFDKEDYSIEGRLISDLSEKEVKTYLRKYNKLFKEQLMNHWKKEKEQNLPTL
jgi:uncharacterized protein YbgA (DUF1722 family)